MTEEFKLANDTAPKAAESGVPCNWTLDAHVIKSFPTHAAAARALAEASPIIEFQYGVNQLRVSKHEIKISVAL